MYKERIKLISSHLNNSNRNDIDNIIIGNTLLPIYGGNNSIEHVDKTRLKQELDSPSLTNYKDQVRQFLENEPLFKSTTGMSMQDQRQLVLEQLIAVAKSGLVKATDVRDAPNKFCALIEILSLYNNNICTKLFVHYSLFCGTITLLGTERHQKYAELASNASIVGCFGMTEVGHGSNVRGIETTATYDLQTKEFVIHSPTPSSHKFWIGAAGLHAHYSSVFANLITPDGVNHGVHCFVVPIRDSNMNVMPGVTIADCGHKIGLNGIDNARIQFNQVRIPRVNLLNKISDVTENGIYQTKIENSMRRFAATMAPFVGGRLYVCKSSAGAAKTCLSIAIRFAHARTQFGPLLGAEQPLITLPNQQRRLMVPLARSIIYDLFTHQLEKELSVDKKPIHIHAHCSGIKAMYSWHAIHSMQQARESCGGQGYRSDNKIGEFKADCDVNATYEGDNTILMQQVSKYIMGLEVKPIPVIQFTNVVQLYNINDLLLLLQSRELHKINDMKDMYQFNKQKDKLPTSDEDQYKLSNQILPFGIDAAFAYMERVIMECAIVRTLGSGPAINTLSLLLLLDTLSLIERDLAWFVMNDKINVQVAKAIPFVIMELCQKVSNISLDIIESFGIPSKCLPSPNLLDNIY